MSALPSSSESYIPVASETIAVPTLHEQHGAIESVNMLFMSLRGLVELTGGDLSEPFLRPVFYVNGREETLTILHWDRMDHWIPQFVGSTGTLNVAGRILTPVGERALIYQLAVENAGDDAVEVAFGLRGCWARTKHTINTSSPLRGQHKVYSGPWNKGLCLEFHGTNVLFGVAVMIPGPEAEIQQSWAISPHLPPGSNMPLVEVASTGQPVWFQLLRYLKLGGRQAADISPVFGFGLEHVAATTAAQHIIHQGLESVLKHNRAWLAQRSLQLSDEKLNTLANRNHFFNYFFSTGRTLDTEQDALVTSRSPRYYVSAAYWDRDSLLWSFPAILLVDRPKARAILEYAFTYQLRNAGQHSRYIDGVQLEPGLELDQLCAPLIALGRYLTQTSDTTILAVPVIREGILRLLGLIDAQQHPLIYLYRSFLQPSDDPCLDPYLTYNNVLVWRALRVAADIADINGQERQATAYRRLAMAVREAIFKYCVVNAEGQNVYAWSVNLEGGYHIYDEPAGSLVLLPFYEFCLRDDRVYQNTLGLLYSPERPHSYAGHSFSELGCDHAPHPWVLSIANSLLCGRVEEARDLLLRAPLDNGLACESIDEDTGVCATGAAFATCAGFLAYALATAFSSKDQ